MIAAIYARKSTEQHGVADEQKSVARQIEHARAYADAKGWTVADEHVYVDDGVSGAEFAEPPGLPPADERAEAAAAVPGAVMSEESRLGREAIETAYALKQIVPAGVRVFFYLEDRERTLDSPTDKIMLSLTAFADELEREKARQRTYDAMHAEGAGRPRHRRPRVRLRQRRRSSGADGAAVARRAPDQRSRGRHRAADLRDWRARASGRRRIAKHLNAEGAAPPRAQQGRPQAVVDIVGPRGLVSRPLSRRDRLEQDPEAQQMGPNAGHRPPGNGMDEIRRTGIANRTRERSGAAHARVGEAGNTIVTRRKVSVAAGRVSSRGTSFRA